MNLFKRKKRRSGLPRYDPLQTEHEQLLFAALTLLGPKIAEVSIGLAPGIFLTRYYGVLMAALIEAGITPACSLERLNALGRKVQEIGDLHGKALEERLEKVNQALQKMQKDMEEAT